MERLRRLPIFDVEKAKQNVRESLRKKREKYGKLIFVSGVILHDPFSPSRNAERMYRYQRSVKKQLGPAVVSALDFFPQEMLIRLSDRTTSELDKYWESEGHGNRRFWQENIEAGFFTDIVMTPGWEDSMPETVEYYLARQNGLTIHFLKDNRQLPSTSG